jgi:hypothetical protein
VTRISVVVRLCDRYGVTSRPPLQIAADPPSLGFGVASTAAATRRCLARALVLRLGEANDKLAS